MRGWHKLSAKRLGLLLAGALVVTDLFVWLAHATGWWPYKLLALAGITLLPGYALLRLLGISFRSITTGLAYSFGLSILVLMLGGLAANVAGYLFSSSQPLHMGHILVAFNSFTALLIGAGTLLNRRAVQMPWWRAKKIPIRAWTIIALCLPLPVMAMMGAYQLNNGAEGVIALTTLIYAAILTGYIFIARNKMPDGTLALFLFILALTVLLMTSLRGWDIVGHDIAREFRVYSMTHQTGFWDIARDRDPYNACLSITILPEVFAKLLNLPGVMVFKVILQIIFAVCPVVVYILLRRYTSKLGALVGVMLFICYPTFINDSAMLTRQGVAYLFFALAITIISHQVQGMRDKILFTLCALGAILSHYSTAYMFVGLFAVAVIFKLGLAWWYKRRHRPLEHHLRRTVISPLFAALLFLMTFLWYTQITGTSGGLTTTLYTSLANIPKIFSDDNKSTDTSTALLFAGGRTQTDLYESYLLDSRANIDEFDARRVQEFMPGLASDDLPLTELGKKALAAGINPAGISTLRQNFARFLQALAVAAVFYAAYRFIRGKPGALRPDFICLTIAGLVLLGLMVALPVLSVNYGILRAFQQVLIFLVVPIALLLAIATQKLAARLRAGLATAGVMLVFLLFTGVFAQVLGGTSPSLSLNNRGLYYGLYYTPAVDAYAFAWLKQHVPHSQDVRAANFHRVRMRDPDYPFNAAGILPSQVSAQTYAYLDPAQVLTKHFYAYYDSSPLIMTFPLEFYDLAKDQIYSTAATRIYK